MKKTVLALCPDGICQEAEHQANDWVSAPLIQVQHAAAQGNADAQFLLGIKYCFEIDVAENAAEGITWLQKAADQGHAKAPAMLDILNEKPTCQAAEEGDASAQFMLGSQYALGLGVEEDWNQAAFWFRKSAEQGNADAQYQLGLSCALGNGVKKDNRQAVAWFRKSAEQGNSNAQYELGVMYEDGKGVKKDRHTAAMLYRRSAEQGHADAAYQLSGHYALRDFEPNFQLAYAWSSVAVANGQTEAAGIRDLAAKFFTPKKLLKVQALADEYVEKYQSKP